MGAGEFCNYTGQTHITPQCKGQSPSNCCLWVMVPQSCSVLYKLSTVIPPSQIETALLSVLFGPVPRLVQSLAAPHGQVTRTFWRS